MLDGFEPEGDAVSNELDRRLLYEVTGLELIQNEFRGQRANDDDSDNYWDGDQAQENE